MNQDLPRMVSFNEAMERLQKRGEERRARVRVEPAGNWFVLFVDGASVLTATGKARRFKSEYDAHRFGKQVTYANDEKAKEAAR